MTQAAFSFGSPSSASVFRPPSPTSTAGRLLSVMASGQWFTLWELRPMVGGSETAISARLRDFRKLGHRLHARQRAGCSRGVWEYRLEVAQ